MATSFHGPADCREYRRLPSLLSMRWLLSLALSVSVTHSLHGKLTATACAGASAATLTTRDGVRETAGSSADLEASQLSGPARATLNATRQSTTAEGRAESGAAAHVGGSLEEKGLLSADFFLSRLTMASLLKYLLPSYWLQWQMGSEFDRSTFTAGDFCNPANPLDHGCRVYFDHIVIGCGAAGCPLARTLSDGGKKVLLIERGMERSYEKTPNCMDIYGCGRVIMDESVSQPVVTKQGIRTHVGAVMGGGTSLNKGIVVEEEPEFFEHLNKNFGYKWDIPLVYKAYNWVGKQIYFPAPQDRPFAKAWRTSLIARGYRPLLAPGKRYTGGPLRTNYRFKLGYVWGGGLFFNSKESFYRYATDTLLGDAKGRERNKNLTVLTDHAVQQILFDTRGRRPRAVCILYRKTAYEDVQTLGAMHNKMTRLIGIKAAAYFMVKHAKKAAVYYTRHDRAATQRLKKACVHVKGEITVSGGAINTPLLLMRSGIGSKQQLEDIGAPVVKILPRVGQNLRDRLFIPLSFFSVIKNTDRLHYPTRICEAIGVAKLGPDCRNFKIGDRSLKCTLAGAEALYGGRMTEGVILGSRYIFPPAFRHHPLVDKAVEIMTYCVHHRPLIQHMRDYLPICVTIEPLINCFRRGSAPFYFTAEPKTSGHVRIDKYGEVEVDFNYMKDEQDVFDAVRGMQNLLEAAKDDSWKGVLEPLSLKGCPVQILNGALDLVATVAQTVYGGILHGPAFQAIRRDINFLLPGNRTVNAGQHAEVLGGLDGPVTDETMPQYAKILLRLQQKQDRVESLLRSTQQIPWPQRSYHWNQMPQQQKQQPPHQTTLTVAEEAVDAFDGYSKGHSMHWSGLRSPGEERKTEVNSPTLQADLNRLQRGKISSLRSSGRSTSSALQELCEDTSFEQGFIRTCPAKDPFTHFYPAHPAEEDGKKLRGEDEPASVPEDDNGVQESRASLDPTDFGRFWSNVLRPGTNSTQWLASYPPILPRTEHPEEVARFVFSFMTSLWHLHGTSEMGKVIDPDFNVIGVDNLSVVDASALTRLTRMNPTATLIMMGRYVGLKKLAAWRKANSRHFVKAS